MTAALLGTGAAVPAALALVVAHRVIHPRRARATRILQVDADHVVLDRTPLTETAGLLGLLYDDEQQLAVLAPEVFPDPQPNAVRRRVRNHPAPPLRVGLGRAVGNVFTSPEELGLPLIEVTLVTALGPAPAWVFNPGAHDTWLLHIHGSLAEREGALRSVAAARATGHPSIVPSFRGDIGAPVAPGGAFTLGQIEWRDIEPALAYAREHGATRVVLIGWSAGASMALRLATSSHHRDLVAGVVGISPVLNWTHVIKTAARLSGLPPVVSNLALRALSIPATSRLLGAPEPLRFRDLAWTSTPVPTLLIHTAGDRIAPYADSITLRDLDRERVELPDLEPAPHALEWNRDPRRFANDLTDWLFRLPAPASPLPR